MKPSRKAKPPHSELLLRLQLESNPEALCMVRAVLLQAAETLRFQEADSRAIVRSVDEALANVIRHAYRGRGGLPIEVTCNKLGESRNCTAPRGIEIVLKDSGVVADLKKLKSRPLKEIRPGGLGLHFIKESMDVVEFSRRNGKNLLRMVKYLASPKPEDKPEGV